MGMTDKKAGKILLDLVTLNLLREGHLTDADLSEPETLVDKVLKKLEGADKLVFTVSYEDNLLSEAKKHRNNNNTEMSILFYATLFEHMLNGIIVETCRRKKYDEKSITEIVKSVSMYGKTSWLFILLGLPKLNYKHVQAIINISNYRNAFVHYKHSWKEEDSDDKERIGKLNLLAVIDKTVIYLKKYDTRLFFNNEKGKFERQMKAVHNHSKEKNRQPIS